MANLVTPYRLYTWTRADSYFIISMSTLDGFIQDCVGTNWNLKSMFVDFASFINSVKIYPCDLGALGTDTHTTPPTPPTLRTIYMGDNPMTNRQGYLLWKSNNFDNYEPSTFKQKMCDIEISSTSFYDFSPFTKYTLFLPYYGFYSIPSNNLLDKKIRIYYTIEPISGMCSIDLVEVKTSGQTETENELYHIETKISLDFPITSSNSLKTIKEEILIGVQGIGSLLGGAKSTQSNNISYTYTKYKEASPIDSTLKSSGTVTNSIGGGLAAIGTLLTTSAGMMQSLYQQGHGNQIGQGYIMWYLPQNPYLIVERSRPLNFNTSGTSNGYMTSDYLHLHGQRSEEITTLSNLSGFAIVREVHLENLNKATNKEIDEIETLLKSGVIF